MTKAVGDEILEIFGGQRGFGAVPGEDAPLAASSGYEKGPSAATELGNPFEIGAENGLGVGA